MQAITIVIGLGRSGIGAARLLKSEGNYVTIFEKEEGEEVIALAKELRNEGIEVKLSQSLEISNFESYLERLSLVVISPGIPWNHPTINKLRAKGIIIKSEIALAWERLKQFKWIGITGTNGKTTVTYLLHHVLKENNLEVEMGGNMGRPATEIAISLKNENTISPKWLIMELSSYQLESEANISPYIGIWTNLTPDHLERHGSLERYANIKKTLLNNSQIAIYNADDKYLISIKDSLKKGVWISSIYETKTPNPPNYWVNTEGIIMENSIELFNSKLFQLKGKHNLNNLLLVVAASRALGIDGESIGESISSFKGVDHRLEKIGCLNGSEVFNDSKATNFDASVTGIDSIPYPCIVIAGGLAKEGDPSLWISTLKRKACAIILFGASRKELYELITSNGVTSKLISVKGLEEAVDQSVQISQRIKAKSIILSPACASFDQYKNFEYRGDHFKELTLSYIKENR